MKQDLNDGVEQQLYEKAFKALTTIWRITNDDNKSDEDKIYQAEMVARNTLNILLEKEEDNEETA